MKNTYVIIDSISELTIKKFEQCLFKSAYKVLIIDGEPSEEELKAAWLSLYTEYIDLSGIAVTAELEIMKTIFYLDCRIKKINLLLHIQYESMDKIGMPCIGGFDKMRFYGHKLYWDKNHPDHYGFKCQLQSIESKEKKYKDDYNEKMKELWEFKKKQKDGEIPLLQKRKEFIRTINVLGKYGYPIDRDKTTVEEFALMVHDYNEAMERESYKN